MLCKRPYAPGGVIVAGCGSHCVSCRINKRREWSTRIMLESLSHEENVFVTLTYSDKHIPKGESLDPDDLRKFWKRLRKGLDDTLNKEINPNKYKCYQRKRFPIRYYACGEYGDSTKRPHYHAIIFGIGRIHQDFIENAWRTRKKELCWKKNQRESIGFTYVGS